MIRQYFTRAVLCAALITTGAACRDSTSPETEGPGIDVTGEFDATFSGSVTNQLSGFAISHGAESRGWSLQLVTPGGENNVLFIVEETGRPEPGEYVIADISTLEDPPAGQYSVFTTLATAPNQGMGFLSTSGRLTIESSTPTSVTGSFQFVGAMSSNATSRITAAGTFTSRNRDD